MRTLPSPLAWALTSPARLLVVVTSISVAIVAVIVAASLATSPSPAIDAASRKVNASASTDVFIPSSSTDDDTETELSSADRERARRTLDAFLNAYLAAQSSHALERLRVLTTSTLAAGLEQTDPRAIPEGPVTRIGESAAGAFEISYEVTLASTRLTVDVVRAADAWRVASIEPSSP